MTIARDFTKALAETFGLSAPSRSYASERARIDRYRTRVEHKLAELTAVVSKMDARLLDHRAEVARLHYLARQSARSGAESRALRLLADKRRAEAKVRDLEDEVAAARRLVRATTRRRDELQDQLEGLRWAQQASAIARLTDDVARELLQTDALAAELSRHQLIRADALAALEAPQDPFEGLAELGNEDDRLLLARWRAKDKARAA